MNWGRDEKWNGVCILNNTHSKENISYDWTSEKNMHKPLEGASKKTFKNNNFRSPFKITIEAKKLGLKFFLNHC